MNNTKDDSEQTTLIILFFERITRVLYQSILNNLNYHKFQSPRIGN